MDRSVFPAKENHMSLSRRALFGLGSGAAAPVAQLVSARGREALVAELGPLAGESGIIPPPQDNEIRLSSNENPLGPPAPAMEAIRDAFKQSGRYPTNSQPSSADLVETLAKSQGCDADNIVLGAGSGELLKVAGWAYTGPDAHLVTASPTYGQPTGVARFQKAEVKAVPVRPDGHLDLERMAAASQGAGLVFFCNPNNPTGLVHKASDIKTFADMVARNSPNTMIQFDEAYHEYVTHPEYESAAAMAVETPNVFVTRTFSKCYGMAGMRVGYAIAHPDTAANLLRYQLGFNTSTPTVAGAYAALQMDGFVEKERARNSAAKKHTVDVFKKMGFEVFDSQTNFIFARINRPASELRAGCRKQGISVGRDFRPMEKTHARISIGTLDEMKRACKVFEEVLS